LVVRTQRTSGIATFHLFWKTRELGEVFDLSADQPLMWGELRPGPGLDESFRGLFACIVDEDRTGQDPPFADELLDDENWWLVDSRGKRWGITMPGVYLDDNIIGWRWRGKIPKWWS
jgi:hypothetical protein